MVFQEALLFPHLSVRANLLYGARQQDAALFVRVVDALGVGALLDRRPGALSGGERQRVSLGRALLARPRLLLLDEPLASLDGARRERVLALLTELAGELDMGMVYVSHAPEEIGRLARRVVTLDAGRLAASTETVERPAAAPRRPRAAVSRRGRPAAPPAWRGSRRSR
jgi:molybdate transport system ATP-binding protein